ncbi:MAG: hypothetical protein AABX70_02925 [Nanoarchaeota archaeon]
MKPQTILILFCVTALVLSSCTKQLITQEALDQLKADKASAETKNTDLQKQADDLKDQLGDIKGKAHLWDQLMTAYSASPVKPTEPGHKWADLGDGSYLFFATDSEMDDLDAIGIALPGKFCKEDQEQLPPGFNHFHPKNCMETDPAKCMGGQGGEEGYWMMHIMLESDAEKPHMTDAPSCAEDTAADGQAVQ